MGKPPIFFAIRTHWVCPWLPASSISARDCTHFPTTVGTQSQHATILDSHGQTTIRKYQKLYYNLAGRICQLLNALTGHCLIGIHAVRLGLSYHDFWLRCKQIDEEESTEHLLCFCPAHNLKRFQTLGSYTLPNLVAIQGVSIPKLLCFLKRTKYFAKANDSFMKLNLEILKYWS